MEVELLFRSQMSKVTQSSLANTTPTTAPELE